MQYVDRQRSYSEAIAFAQRIADAVNTLRQSGCSAEYDVGGLCYRVDGQLISDEDLIARAAVAKSAPSTPQ